MLALTAYLWQSTKRLLRPLVRRCWTCPICGYYGPFYGVNASYSIREHAGCPSCNHLERHRLQWLVLGRITPNLPLDQMSVLHFAPERFFSDYLRPRVARYETADLERVGVDHRVDLRSLPFADSSYDFVYASHVLEHIDDDQAAIREIRRILRPGGLAILPVPINQQVTVEYPGPNPQEIDHVRAPGPDYFDRYQAVFRRVQVFTSDDFPAKYQTYVFEDLSRFPTTACPHRRPVPGRRHRNYVPVCYV